MTLLSLYKTESDKLEKKTVYSRSFPSYPSGHATFAGVSAGVFILFFGTDAINFTDKMLLKDYVWAMKYRMRLTRLIYNQVIRKF